jgi:hypothetical protein
MPDIDELGVIVNPLRLDLEDGQAVDDLAGRYRDGDGGGGVDHV